MTIGYWIQRENCELSYLYIPNKAILEYDSDILKAISDDPNKFKKMDFLISKGQAINVSEQQIQFLVETGNKLEKIKARFEKHGKRFKEILNRDLEKIVNHDIK